MTRVWGGVLVAIVVAGCSPPAARGCYDGCLAGTLCDESTLYCVASDGGAVDAGVVDAGPIDSGVALQDGGHDAGFSPDGGPLTCATAGCPAWSECRNEVCVDRYTGISVTAPARTGGPFAVAATLQLRAGATPNPPATLELSAQVGTQPALRITLGADGGAWTGTVPATLEGTWVSTVTRPASQLSGTATTLVDLSAPRFEVTVAPSPLRRVQDGGVNERDPADPPGVTAWRRDESGGIVVRALDTDVVPSSVQIRVGDLLVPHDGGCLASGCSLLVDYSLPTFNAWRGALPIVIAAADDLGNSGSFDGGAVRLTRVQWHRSEPTLSGNLFVGAVALEPDGTIYVGRGAFPSGELAIFEPSGDLRETRPLIATPTTAPMLGQADAGGAIYLGINMGSGPSLTMVGGTGTQSQGPAVSSQGPVLLLPSLQGPESAYWAAGSTMHSISYRASSTPQANTDFVGGTGTGCFQLTARRAHLGGVVDGVAIRYLEQNLGVPFGGLTSSNVGQLAAPVDPVMAWEQPDASFIGVNGPTTGRTFWDAHSLITTEYPDAAPGPLLPFAFRQGEAWYPSIHSLCHGVPGAIPTCLTLPGNGGFGYGGVLTAGQKVIIVGSHNGTDLLLMQVDGTTLTIDWEAPLAQPGVPAELQHVRCLRGHLGVGVGVSGQGELISAVIDQPGIDSTADWAQFSHDPRNTFNFSTPLAPYRCP